MLINFIRSKSITRLAPLALLALCLVQTQIRAQQAAPSAAHEIEEVRFVFHTISWGMVRNQTARFTLFNLNAPESPNEPSEPAQVQVKLFDAQGRAVAESAEMTIPAGGFLSFDFDRSDIPHAGERRTGRLQLRAEMIFKVMQRVASDGSNSSPSVDVETMKLKRMIQKRSANTEVIDNLTGATTVSFKPKEIVVVGSKVVPNNPDGN